MSEQAIVSAFVFADVRRRVYLVPSRDSSYLHIVHAADPKDRRVQDGIVAAGQLVCDGCEGGRYRGKCHAVTSALDLEGAEPARQHRGGVMKLAITAELIAEAGRVKALEQWWSEAIAHVDVDIDVDAKDGCIATIGARDDVATLVLGLGQEASALARSPAGFRRPAAAGPPFESRLRRLSA